MRTIEWHAGGASDALAAGGPEVWLIDQTRLPLEQAVVRCRTYQDVAQAIRTMQVRGAPAIGIAAAMGVALGALAAPDEPAGFFGALEQVYTALAATRPTAVNLFWAIDQMRRRAQALAGRPVAEIKAALVAEAQRLADDDVARCRRIGEAGEALLDDGDGVLTHCNAGALACVELGTALAPIYLAHAAGKRLHVLVNETRPFLQGARLTTWELMQAGIDCTLITDSMAAHFMARGCVQKVLVGADRIAANGDVANKIGTYGLAILAHAHGIPFYVAAPTSTIDLATPSGEGIPIEERAESEVTHFRGVPIAPPGVRAAHPAFDVTPHRYVTAIVTDAGVLYPPYGESLARAVEAGPAQPHLESMAVPSGGRQTWRA